MHEFRELLAEAERFDGTPPVSDQALLAVSQGRRTLHTFDDAVGIVGEGELDLVVRPSARGRGVATAALAEMLRLSRGDRPDKSNEPDSSGPDEQHGPAGGRELRAWAHGDNPAAAALLSRHGFQPVRTLLRMILDPNLLHDAIQAARPITPEFEMRPFADDEHAADEWVRVNAAAFASHPEQGKMTRQDFDALTREPWFVGDDLRLAFSGDSLAGFTWVKTTHDGERTETELYAIGVDPAFAGRGLGAGLLGETLRRMRLHDPDRISLYVDGDNVGAISLYERAGFVIEQRSTQWLLTE